MVNRSAVIPDHPGDIPTGTLPRKVGNQLFVGKEKFEP
jgi:hypothetical protein